MRVARSLEQHDTHRASVLWMRRDVLVRYGLSAGEYVIVATAGSRSNPNTIIIDSTHTTDGIIANSASHHIRALQAYNRSLSQMPQIPGL